MERTQNENPLGYAPVTGLIVKFAIPSIISMLVTAAYNITDQIFIGHVVGMLGNAATNVAFPVTTLTTAFAQLAGIGTAANFNICLGAKREEDAKRFLGTGLTLMGLLGLVVLAVVLTLKTPILLLCGATENVLPYAQLYLGITGHGLPLPKYFCTIVPNSLHIELFWILLDRVFNRTQSQWTSTCIKSHRIVRLTGVNG